MAVRERLPALRSEIIAGATTAALLVPQSMAYALLAGLPPQMGLYAATVPLLAYALFGQSRHLAIGPVALDSLLLAAAIAPLASVGSARAIELSLLLTFLVGALQVLFGITRLGFLANFLSRPVLGGFTSAAALLIAVSQLGPLSGINVPAGDLAQVVGALVRGLAAPDWATLAFGVAAWAGSRGLRAYVPWLPGGLVVITAGTLASALLGAGAAGVAVVGVVPEGLPRPGSPLGSLEAGLALLPAALGIALVSFVESFSVARRLSGGSIFSANRELGALGAANLASSVFGGYVVAGGLSRSAVHARAGAQTRVAGAITAVFVGLTLAFLTPLFRALPKAVLAALVLDAVMSLVDVAYARRLYRVQRSEFWLLACTFAGTLIAGVQLGLIAGAGASLLWFLIRTTRPHLAVLGRLPGTESYRNIKRFPEAECRSDQLILRLDAQFYFGNVTFLKNALDELCRARPGLTTVILDASGMNQLDSSALDALLEIDRDLAGKGLRLSFAEVKGPVRDVLERSGWLAELRDQLRIFLRVHDAVNAASGSSPPDPAHASTAGRVGEFA